MDETGVRCGERARGIGFEQSGKELEYVGNKLDDVILQDLRERSVDGFFELLGLRRCGEPDESTDGLEEIIVEAWIGGIVPNYPQEVDEVGEEEVRMRYGFFSKRYDDSHHCTHKELVLLDLLRRRVFAHKCEEALDYIPREREKSSARYCRFLAISGTVQYPFNGYGAISMNNVVGRSQMFDKHRKSFLPMLYSQLASEDVQEPKYQLACFIRRSMACSRQEQRRRVYGQIQESLLDGIHLKYIMGCFGNQVLRNAFLKKINDIYIGIDVGNSSGCSHSFKRSD